MLKIILFKIINLKKLIKLIKNMLKNPLANLFLFNHNVQNKMLIISNLIKSANQNSNHLQKMHNLTKYLIPISNNSTQKIPANNSLYT
jgi:hypothetical protein